MNYYTESEQKLLTRLHGDLVKADALQVERLRKQIREIKDVAYRRYRRQLAFMQTGIERYNRGE